MDDVTLLDCTLRDGSYVLDFQFDEEDTSLIVSALAGAGVELVEVGHGLGLNASASGKGQAAVPDEAYMRAAAAAAGDARWGMFFIPGIGRPEDLELAAEHGMDFVRVGTNATEVEEAEEHVRHAAELGMTVASNLMKSYVLSPEEIGEVAARAAAWGADAVYVVDSAGAMVPGAVRDYVAAALDAAPVDVGFHGHDNLGLAIANALAAAEAGASYVDASLQGLGRGGGNAATEVLAAVLDKVGRASGLDVLKLMDVSERLIRPLLREKGWDPIDVTSGLAGFHSSFLQTILEYSESFDVDARDLILEVCEVDRVYAPEELVEEKARELRARGREATEPTGALFPASRGSRARRDAASVDDAVSSVVQSVRATARKRGWPAVMNLVSPHEPVRDENVSSFVQQEFGYVIGSALVHREDTLETIVGAADGRLDYFFVDAVARPYLDRPLSETTRELAGATEVVGYNDDHVWARTVYAQIRTLLGGLDGRRIAVFGGNDLAVTLGVLLLEEGTSLTAVGPEEDLGGAVLRERLATGRPGSRLRVAEEGEAGVEDVDAITAFSGETTVGPGVVRRAPGSALIFDGWIGGVRPEALGVAHERGLPVIRPDMRGSLASELTFALRNQRLVGDLMGRRELGGVPVVAGGLVARRGDVVVDSVVEPTRVVGVADGQGTVLYDYGEEFADRVRRVEEAIFRRRTG